MVHTPMKRLALLTLTLLATAGCVDDDMGIRLLNAHPLSSECSPDSVAIIGGSLNINAPAGRYIAAFDIESVRDSASNSAGGAPVSDSRGADFIVSEEQLSFTSSPDLGLADATIPIYFVLRAGSGDGSFVTLDLVPPDVLAAAAARVASSGTAVTLQVTVKVKGKFATGATAESNPATFPVTIYAGPGAPACPAGEQLASNGPCGLPPGQDGVPYECEAP